VSHQKSKHQIEKEHRIAEWRRLGSQSIPLLHCSFADVADLERRIRGQVVVPADPTYDAARQLSNPAFQKFPCIIAYCETPGDVRACLELSRHFNLWIATRSSGHNTAGYSVNDEGLVIDLSRMQYVHLEHVRRKGSRKREPHVVAHVGAGSQWGYVYSVLDSANLHIPGGGCEGVCVAGFVQGGGYSLSSRMYGMNSDTVAGLTVMLADGRVVTANEHRNAPLFWAMRGGTGNNFGVLLEVKYRTVRTGPLWGFKIQWEIDDAPAAILEMQNNYMKTGTDRLGFRTNATTQEGRQVLLMGGVYRGTEREGREAIDSLLQSRGASLLYSMNSSFMEINRALEEFPEPTVNIPPGAKEDKQSGYIREPLSLSEWEEIIDFFKQTPNPYSAFELEPYGGAINAVPRAQTAFIHRDAVCDFFLDVFWVSEDEREHAQRYLDDFMAMMQPYFDRPDGRPQAYQNYPRRTQTNYLDLYFDGVIQDLVTVKKMYDPSNVFRFEQSIPLDVPEKVGRDPASPGFTGTEMIIQDY
jgi:hypothetical protein